MVMMKLCWKLFPHPIGYAVRFDAGSEQREGQRTLIYRGGEILGAGGEGLREASVAVLVELLSPAQSSAREQLGWRRKKGLRPFCKSPLFTRRLLHCHNL